MTYVLAEFQWDVVFDNQDLLLKGLRNTVWIAVVSMSISIVFGLVLAMMRLSRFKPISWLASLYINVIRGIPLLVLIFYVFFGLAIWLDIKFTNFQAGVISLAVFHTAFMAEIYRAIEAADAYVFILTPASVSSEICLLELAHAVRNNKRLVPIVGTDVEASGVPETLAKLNWIF